MRFLMMYTPDANAVHAPPTAESLAEMNKFIDEATKAGTLLSTGGLLPLSQGARVSISAGKITVTDGPFTEAKEVIAGYAIIEAKSKDEAIESAKHFLKVAGDGETEIRQLMDGPPPLGEEIIAARK